MAELNFINVNRRPQYVLAALRFRGGEEEAETLISWIRRRGGSARWTAEVKGLTKYDPVKESYYYTGSPERIRIDTDRGTQDLNTGDWLYVDEEENIVCLRDEVFQATFQKVVDNERL